MEGVVAALNYLVDPSPTGNPIVRILLLGLLVLFFGAKIQAVCYIVAIVGNLYTLYNAYRFPSKPKWTLIAANAATIILPLIFDVSIHSIISVKCTQKEKQDDKDCSPGWYYWYWLTKCTIVLFFHLTVLMTKPTLASVSESRAENGEILQSEKTNLDSEGDRVLENSSSIDDESRINDASIASTTVLPELGNTSAEPASTDEISSSDKLINPRTESVKDPLPIKRKPILKRSKLKWAFDAHMPEVLEAITYQIDDVVRFMSIRGLLSMEELERVMSRPLGSSKVVVMLSILNNQDRGYEVLLEYLRRNNYVVADTIEAAAQM